MIAILILIYLVSVIGAYKYIQKADVYKHLGGLILILFPLINSIMTVIIILYYLNDKIDWNKFFNRW